MFRKKQQQKNTVQSVLYQAKGKVIEFGYSNIKDEKLPNNNLYFILSTGHIFYIRFPIYHSTEVSSNYNFISKVLEKGCEKGNIVVHFYSNNQKCVLSTSMGPKEAIFFNSVCWVNSSLQTNVVQQKNIIQQGKNPTAPSNY